MKQYKRQSLSLILISLFLLSFSCNRNPTIVDEDYECIDESSIVLSPGSILVRNIFYDKNTIIRSKVDTNDFKAVYSFQEILKILANSDSATLANHGGIIVDDDCYYKNIYELVYYSFDIIFGYVLKVEYKWDEIYDIKCINTYVKLQNIKSYKNETTSDIISLKDFGGRIGDIGSDILYDPRPIYQERELVLITLKKEDENYSTFGRSQGKFSVF